MRLGSRQVRHHGPPHGGSGVCAKKCHPLPDLASGAPWDPMPQCCGRSPGVSGGAAKKSTTRVATFVVCFPPRPNIEAWGGAGGAAGLHRMVLFSQTPEPPCGGPWCRTWRLPKAHANPTHCRGITGASCLVTAPLGRPPARQVGPAAAPRNKLGPRPGGACSQSSHPCRRGKHACPCRGYHLEAPNKPGPPGGST